MLEVATGTVIRTLASTVRVLMAVLAKPEESVPSNISRQVAIVELSSYSTLR